MGKQTISHPVLKCKNISITNYLWKLYNTKMIWGLFCTAGIKRKINLVFSLMNNLLQKRKMKNNKKKEFCPSDMPADTYSRKEIYQYPQPPGSGPALKRERKRFEQKEEEKTSKESGFNQEQLGESNNLSSLDGD